jgi:uncharacterized membrane protein
MKARHLVSILLAVSASISVPAFASGYGPAPFYSPHVGAPVSQRGQSVQTLAAERGDASIEQQGYGGTAPDRLQWGVRSSLESNQSLYAHH